MKTTINKTFKRIIASATSAIMCLTMITATASVAYADNEADNIDNGVVEEAYGGIMPFGAEKPTEEYSWDGGNYIATLDDLKVNTGSWTVSYFKTNTSSLYLKCDLTSGSSGGERKLKAELYKKNSSGVWTYVTYKTATIQTSGMQRLQFSNLNNNTDYCFRLYNATTTGSGNRYINGTVEISRSYIS